jgi:hypothetical protein
MRSQSNLGTGIIITVGVAVCRLALFLLKGFRKEEISFFGRLLALHAPTASDRKTEE